MQCHALPAHSYTLKHKRELTQDMCFSNVYQIYCQHGWHQGHKPILTGYPIYATMSRLMNTSQAGPGLLLTL